MSTVPHNGLRLCHTGRHHPAAQHQYLKATAGRSLMAQWERCAAMQSVDGRNYERCRLNEHPVRVQHCWSTDEIDPTQENWTTEKEKDLRRMKLYIAGPMSGYTDWNFYAFLDAELWLWQNGFNAINPARMDLDAGFEPRGSSDMEPTPGFSRRDVLKKDLVAICDGADGIALLPGWEKSTGAKEEVALAEALNIPVRTVKEWAEDSAGPWIEVAINE